MMRFESFGGVKLIKEFCDRVVFNVGGKVFEFYISMLKNILDILLVRILDNCLKLDYDFELGEYFFD